LILFLRAFSALSEITSDSISIIFPPSVNKFTINEVRILVTQFLHWFWISWSKNYTFIFNFSDGKLANAMKKCILMQKQCWICLFVEDADILIDMQERQHSRGHSRGIFIIVYPMIFLSTSNIHSFEFKYCFYTFFVIL
jgi:hypothetical protein